MNREENMRLFLEADKIRKVQNITGMTDEELEERITAIDDLFVFMEVQRLDNPAVKQKLDRIITRIYNSEISGIEKDFGQKVHLLLGKQARGTFYGQYCFDEGIKINTDKLYKNLQSSDYNQRMDGCKKIVHTILHEIQHHRQYIMSTREVSSKEALQFGKDYAVNRILGKQYYQSNYSEFGLENDANEVAERKEIESIGYDKQKNIDMLKHKIIKSTAQYEVKNIKGSNGQIYDIKKQDREELVDKVLDREICINKNIELLNKYPILKKVYNMDGTKKGTKQLIEEMKSEKKEILQNHWLSKEEYKQAINNSEDMYLDIIYKSLLNTTRTQLNQINKKDLNEVLNKMESKFESEAYELIEAGEKYKNLQNEVNDSESHMKEQVLGEQEELRLYVQSKLMNQKSLIKAVRKEALPQKPANTRKQSLKEVNQFDKFMSKMESFFEKLIQPIKKAINKFTEPKHTKNIDNDEKTERLIDNERTEKLVNNKRSKQSIKENKANKFEIEIKIENWRKTGKAECIIGKHRPKTNMMNKDTKETDER